jgi:hypothetical protein
MGRLPAIRYIPSNSDNRHIAERYQTFLGILPIFVPPGFCQHGTFDRLGTVSYIKTSVIRRAPEG